MKLLPGDGAVVADEKLQGYCSRIRIRWNPADSHGGTKDGTASGGRIRRGKPWLADRVRSFWIIDFDLARASLSVRIMEARSAMATIDMAATCGHLEANPPFLDQVGRTALAACRGMIRRDHAPAGGRRDHNDFSLGCKVFGGATKETLTELMSQRVVATCDLVDRGLEAICFHNRQSNRDATRPSRCCFADSLPHVKGQGGVDNRRGLTRHLGLRRSTACRGRRGRPESSRPCSCSLRRRALQTPDTLLNSGQPWVFCRRARLRGSKNRCVAISTWI